MAAPLTVVSGKTCTLAQRLRSTGSDTSITITSTETPLYTSGVMKFGTGSGSEWIAFTGVTAVSGTTYTLTGCTRGLDKDATSLTDNSSGGKKDLSVGTTGKYVLHSAQVNKYVQNDADNTLSGNNILTGSLTASSTSKAVVIVQSVTTAERDALTGVVNGTIVYNSTTGEFNVYQGGAWSAVASGSTQPNMSLTVAGKGEEATAAEIIANTQTGGTAAELVVNPKYLSDASVITSAGAADAGKYVRTNSDGIVDYTLQSKNLFTGTAGETLVAGNWIYRNTSDGKLYKADYSTVEKATVIGFIYAGGAADATVYYQGNGSKFITTGLTAGSEYYLSTTAGQITTTVPVFNSGSVIPVKIGYASSTTELDMQIQRLPRRIYFKNTENSGTQFVVTTTGAAQTITCGFNIDRVEVQHFGYMENLGHPSAGFGKYIPSESVQMCAYYNFSSGVLSAGYFGNVNYIMFMAEVGGTPTTCSATATVDGGNNVVITWTNTSSTTALVNYNGIVYERL